MKQDEIIIVQGVPLTPKMLETMRSWELGSEKDDNDTEYFLESLGKIQDFLCEHILDNGLDNPKYLKYISSFLIDIVNLKDAFRPFAEYRSEE